MKTTKNRGYGYASLLALAVVLIAAALAPAPLLGQAAPPAGVTTAEKAPLLSQNVPLSGLSAEESTPVLTQTVPLTGLPTAAEAEEKAAPLTFTIPIPDQPPAEQATPAQTPPAQPAQPVQPSEPAQPAMPEQPAMPMQETVFPPTAPPAAQPEMETEAEPQHANRKKEMLIKAGWTALWYIPNRALDLVDATRLSVTAGPTAGYNMHLTDKIMAGVMEMDCHRFGFKQGRHDFGYEYVYASNECGARWFDYECGSVKRPKWQAALDLHFFVGGRVGLELDEFCDFLLGFACYDRKGDDRGPTWDGKPDTK